ncbi:MAG TPA: response regulator transcription factor [Verrucomicrobiae bacterium]|jgi:DNA-binding NarL/FixJ family response regulator|nr:response regulator transcription factor [Verrucomicrobiae bacterium]
MNGKKIKSSPRKHRILLVDDHPVTRDGLARLINHEADLEVCGTAGTAAGAAQEVDRQKPDLVIIDVSLGKGASGLELIKDLVSSHRRLKMLALSTHDEALYAERALRAGAKGYVMKQEPTEHVMQAVRKILNGEVHLSKRMSDRMLHKMTQAQFPPTVSDIDTLSDRELEVYRLLGQGRGTRQIAAELHLSISTVETHRAHIKEKLNLNSTPELLRHAVEWVHSQAS